MNFEKGVLFELVRKAGDNLLQEFHREKKIITREKHDIKLELDRQTEIYLKEQLSRYFPDIGFIAEELDTSREELEGHSYWIIDPIDGTSNYAASIPHFCISIAFRKDGETRMGVIYDPVREEMFWAEKGKGAFCNNRRLNLAKSDYQETFCVMGLFKTRDTIEKGLNLLQEVAHDFNKVRITGSAALDLAWVASGRFQVFFEYGIRLWDIAAGTLLVQEAGGKVLAEPYRDIHSYFVLAGIPAYCEIIQEKRASLSSENISF